MKKPGYDAEACALTGYKRNKWQKEISATEARFKIICIGRRGGKSHYVAHDPHDGLVEDFLLPKQKVWIVAPNYDLTQRIWNEVYQMAITCMKPVVASIHNTKGDYKIETLLGSTIEAKSGEDAEKLVGIGLTKLIVDEAALLKEKAWTQSLRPTLIDHKGRAIFISTPKGKNWFWELWMRGQEPDQTEWKSWRYTTFDNEYIDKTEIEKLAAQMPEFEYRQEILAMFEETSEQIFRKTREAAIGEEQPPQRGHRYQIGVDLGRKTAWSVITVIDESVEPFRVVKIDRFRKVDWNVQKQRLKAIYDQYPSFRMRVDTTGLGDPVEEDLLNAGIRTEPFIFNERTTKQLIDKLAMYIEEGKIIYPKNETLLNEMETFGREISKLSGRVKYKAMGKAQDDMVYSLALACWGLPDKMRRRLPRNEDDFGKDRPLSDYTGY